MAWPDPPTLQAQGATLANTTGTLSPTIPTHQADDIIVVAAVYWGPNTAGDAAQIPTPSNYTLLGSQVGQPASANRDGWSALFWRRVTGAGTTVTINRGASWDTGTDTCFGARAYVIRGCRTTGNPFEASAQSGPHTAANQAFPAVTVSGLHRLVVQFGNSMDNQAFAMTSSGWTTGTEDNDSAGTDCSFQTARKSDVSASTSADGATVSAPVQGAYAFHGVSFVPPNPSPTRGRIGFAEIEGPFVATRGRMAWTEVETPLVPTRGRVGWAEVEVPLTSTRARLSFGEVEVPSPPGDPTRGLVAWGELETPLVATRGRIAWAEVELPTLPTRGRIAWAEGESPGVPTRGLVGWSEIEAPFQATRGRIAWTELHAPLAPTRGRIAWSEAEAPLAATRGLVAWSEGEVPAVATRGRIAWACVSIGASGSGSGAMAVRRRRR